MFNVMDEHKKTWNYKVKKCGNVEISFFSVGQWKFIITYIYTIGHSIILSSDTWNEHLYTKIWILLLS